MMRPATPGLCGASFLIFALALSGCHDAAETSYKVVTAKDVEDLPKWLTPKDRVDPALWLRSREVGHDVLPSDPEVDRLRRALHQAAIRFYEDPRMIANRTAQTSDMLAEAGRAERDVDIVIGMVDVADSSNLKKLYGEMCQHYLNLRSKGVDRTAAIADLSASYRAQAQDR